MNIKALDTVVLEKDFPEYGLRRGDIGAVVEVYGAEGIEVEFVTGSGITQALITLNQKDIRAIKASEILAVRSLDAA
jgi:hypothetical protein